MAVGGIGVGNAFVAIGEVDGLVNLGAIEVEVKGASAAAGHEAVGDVGADTCVVLDTLIGLSVIHGVRIHVLFALVVAV